MRQSPSGHCCARPPPPGGEAFSRARPAQKGAPYRGAGRAKQGLRGFATAAATLTICDGRPRRGVGDAAPYSAAPPTCIFPGTHV